MAVTLGNQSITSSTGNLGIGTDSPLTRLTVVAPSTTNAETVELRGFRNFVAETRGATAILAVSFNTRNAHDFGAIRFEQNPATSDGGGALVRMFAGGASSSFAANTEFLRATAITGADGVNNIQFRTLGIERMRINSAGQLRTKVTGASNVLMDSFGCRAWVNFNGTGTVAIRASGNVSSITDNGTGNYTVNFTTAMPDANYSVGGSTTINNTGNYGRVITPAFTTPQTSSSIRIGTSSGTAAIVDCIDVHVQIFR